MWFGISHGWPTQTPTFFLFIGLWVSHYGACFSAVWVPTWRGCLPYVLLITCGQSRIKAVWETHHIGIHCHPSAQEGWGRRRVSLMPAWTTKKKKKTTPPAGTFSFDFMTVLVLCRMAWHSAMAALVKKRPQIKVLTWEEERPWGLRFLWPQIRKAYDLISNSSRYGCFLAMVCFIR